MWRIAAVLLLTALHFSARAQGIITTLAGSTWVFPSDGRPALAAPLGGIKGLAVDGQNNLYVVDPDNHMVMKINPSGVLTVVAGSGIPGSSGDLGLAVNASLHCPVAVAVDSKGNLYVADQCDYRVREVTPDGIIS